MVIRCAKCGSKNVDIKEKKEYDLKKGIVGTALLGAGGAVMGVNGKEKKFYHCKECGEILTYVMDEATANSINKHLANPERYEILLSVDKKIYPNIEWDNSKTEQLNQQTPRCKTNNELVYELCNYMAKYQIYVLSEKEINEMFNIEEYGEISLYNAFPLLCDKGIHSYFEEDSCGYYYYFIPEEFYTALQNIILTEITEKKEIRESKLKSIIKLFLYDKIKIIAPNGLFEEMAKEILCEIKFNRAYVMTDRIEIYGYIKENIKIIPFNKEKNDFLENVMTKVGKNFKIYEECINQFIDKEGIKYKDLLQKASIEMIKKNIVIDEKEAKAIIARTIINGFKSLKYQVNFEDNKSNPHINLVNKKQKELVKIEKIENKEQSKRKERNRKKVLDAQSLQYYEEIEKILIASPGICCVDIYEKGNKIKELGSNKLLEFLKKLVELKLIKSFKLEEAATLYFYIDDENIDVKSLKEKIKKEEQKRINSLHAESSQTNHTNLFSNNSKNGCYVATCVYGSYDCPEVWTLRRFRDYYLDKKLIGRIFIKVYYSISPICVKVFGKNKYFVIFNKMILDKFITKLKMQGYKDTRYIDKY